jgi:XisI protein/XisH protein
LKIENEDAKLYADMGAEKLLAAERREEKIAVEIKVFNTTIHHYANFPSSDTQVESIAICDSTHDTYLVMHLGWNHVGRVHSVPIHLRIKNNKVWFEWNGTDQEIAQQLIDAGIPQEDIVLALYRPERRKLTGFAIAQES